MVGLLRASPSPARPAWSRAFPLRGADRSVEKRALLLLLAPTLFIGEAWCERPGRFWVQAPLHLTLALALYLASVAAMIWIARSRARRSTAAAVGVWPGAAVDDPSLASPPDTALAASPTRRPGANSRISVLAAEDNPINQRLLATVLDLFGMDLHVAADGAQAVEAWRSQTFDVVLMDIQMPVMDGVSATRAIRAAEAEQGVGRIPIIALSANGLKHQVEEYLEAGMDMHVPKPIELARLRDALDQVMRGPVAVWKVPPAPPSDITVAC